MVQILGLTQFVFIICICIYEFNRKSSALFLWATLFLMFGVMHLISSFVGDSVYSNIVLSEASIFVIIFCVIYMVFRYTIACKILKKSRRIVNDEVLEELTLEQKNYTTLIVIFFVASVLIRIIPMVHSSGGILNTSWGAMRSYAASLSYASSLQITTVLFYALSGMMVVCYVEKKYFMLLICSISVLGSVLVTRNRVEILPMFVAIITIVLMHYKKITLKLVLLGIVMAGSIIFVVYGLRAIRYYGTVSNFYENFTWNKLIAQIKIFLSTNNGELGLRRYFYYFISKNNHFMNFGKGYTYIRMILVFIPTSWSFGIKPDDFAQVMGNAVGLISGGSMHPTLFGDCYANLGFLGVILGGFWALYATLADRIIFSRKSIVISLLLYSLNGTGYCIMGRGAVYNGFWNVAWGTLFLIIVERIIISVRVGKSIRMRKIYGNQKQKFKKRK